VGRPVNSGGDFTASVAVSSQTGNGELLVIFFRELLTNDVVCVLNGGENNGVQCFRPTSRGLVKIANSNRALNLPLSTPPVMSNTTFSVSTIQFSPDGSRLVVDVKGVVDSNIPGFLAVWNVNPDGSLSQCSQSFPAPTHAGQQHFGMIHLQGKEGFILADASQGGLMYDFSNGYGPQATIKNIVVPGHQITCWASFSSKSNSYFITDAGTAIISELSIDIDTLNATMVKQYQLPRETVIVDTTVGTLGRNQ
jgi:hypothetical protein